MYHRNEQVLGLCNFKCYHYVVVQKVVVYDVLGLCNFKCYHYVFRLRHRLLNVLGLCNFKCYHYLTRTLSLLKRRFRSM